MSALNVMQFLGQTSAHALHPQQSSFLEITEMIERGALLSNYGIFHHQADSPLNQTSPAQEEFPLGWGCLFDNRYNKIVSDG